MRVKVLVLIIFSQSFTSFALEARPKSKTNNEPLRAELVWAQGMNQAAKIFEQVWPLVQSEVHLKKLPPRKNLFFLMEKVFEVESKTNKKSKKIFDCERISSSSSGEAVAGAPLTKTFYFSCQKNRTAFSRLKRLSSDRVEIEFDPQGLDAVLGLQTSILGKKFTCLLTQEKKVLTAISCQQLQMDYNSQYRIVFENFKYAKNEALQIQASIIIFDQMKAYKSIQFEVPQTGVVKIVETYLSPPPGYTIPGTQKKAAVQAPAVDAAQVEKNNTNKAENPAVLNPASEAALPDQIFKAREDDLQRQKKEALKPKGPDYSEPEYIEVSPQSQEPTQEQAIEQQQTQPPTELVPQGGR
jgi:hypothetical protein